MKWFLSYNWINVANKIVSVLTQFNWSFTGFTMPHFMIVYQFIKPSLDKKNVYFEEYGGAFK